MARSKSESQSAALSGEQLLEHLKQIAAGIAGTFGSPCETLIHDMTKPGHPIIAIWNGEVSGREVGSTLNIYGIDDAGKPSHYQEYNETRDLVNTLVVTKDGRFIKSTTINFTGEGYHYALGINYDYTELNGTIRSLSDFISIGANLSDEMAGSGNTQLEDVFTSCLAEIGKPISEMKKNDRLRLVALLMQQGAFSYQKSVIYIAEQLGISRYTLYKYCHEVEANAQL